MRFSPGIEEVEASPGDNLDPRLLEHASRGLLIVDHEPEVPVVVARLPAPLAEREELVAHVEKGHSRCPTAQLEVEKPAVEGECLLDIADLEGDVVDAHQPWKAAHVASLGRDTGNAPETIDIRF
jgi:hypothetical protein